MMSYRSSLAFVSLLLRELIKGETYASLLNIHGGDIRIVSTHLVYFLTWSSWRVVMTIHYGYVDNSTLHDCLWKLSVHCVKHRTY